jgi:RNA recognition motif-containing protein
MQNQYNSNNLHFPFPFPPPQPPQIIPTTNAQSLSSAIGLVSAAAPVELGQPNCTLYIQNLPEKPNPLKHLPPLLTDLFAPFGPLKRAPVVRKSLALNGQAWVIFENLQDAERAVNELQGYRIWGKSMVIRFARYKSDCCVVGSEALAQERKLRESDRIERLKQAPRATRRQLLNRLMSANPTSLQSVPISSGPDVLLPNRILFLQNINSSPENLVGLFRKYPGFVDLRTIPNRPDVAFVEYETEAQATTARQILDRTELLPNHFLRVSFARR